MFCAAHPDFPFKEEVYRKRPTEYYARVIPRYAGHRPGWTHAPGVTLGKYAGETMVDFSNTTRKKSKSLRTKTVPAAVFAMPDPKPPPPTVPLYAPGPSYIPHTTLYTPAAVERFGHGFSTLSRDAFAKPVPAVPAPLQNALDGKTLDHLALPSSYMGFKPRALPFLCRHLEEREQDRGRQREIEAIEQQQQQAAEAAAAQQPQQQQQEPGSAQDDYPAEMYDFLDRAQGDERFTQAVHEAAEKYRQERDANGPEAGMRMWEDHKAFLEMTFMK